MVKRERCIIQILTKLKPFALEKTLQMGLSNSIGLQMWICWAWQVRHIKWELED